MFIKTLGHFPQRKNCFFYSGGLKLVKNFMISQKTKGAITPCPTVLPPLYHFTGWPITFGPFFKALRFERKNWFFLNYGKMVGVRA